MFSAHWHSSFLNSIPYEHSIFVHLLFSHFPDAQSLSLQQAFSGMHLLSHSLPCMHSHLPCLHVCPVVQFISLHKSVCTGVSSVSRTGGWYSEVGTVCIAVSQAAKIRSKTKKYLLPIFDTTAESYL